MPALRRAGGAVEGSQHLPERSASVSRSNAWRRSAMIQPCRQSASPHAQGQDGGQAGWIATGSTMIFSVNHSAPPEQVGKPARGDDLESPHSSSSVRQKGRGQQSPKVCGREHQEPTGSWAKHEPVSSWRPRYQNKSRVNTADGDASKVNRYWIATSGRRGGADVRPRTASSLFSSRTAAVSGTRQNPRSRCLLETASELFGGKSAPRKVSITGETEFDGVRSVGKRVGSPPRRASSPAA